MRERRRESDLALGAAVAVVRTSLLLRFSFCSLREREMVPPGLEAGLGGRMCLLRVVEGRGGHEFVCAGA